MEEKSQSNVYEKIGENIAENSAESDGILGKFKDVNALINAYNSLQSEFTKRCQRLKELEKEAESVKKDSAESRKIEDTEKIITTKQREEILRDYLKSVSDSKQKAVLMDGAGVGVKTPAEKPKSIAEAGNLAKKIFN